MHLSLNTMSEKMVSNQQSEFSTLKISRKWTANKPNIHTHPYVYLHMHTHIKKALNVRAGINDIESLKNR